MRILLINPPSPKGFSCDRDSMGGFGNLNNVAKVVNEEDVEHRHPLSLLYTASILDNLGHSLRIVDFVFLEKIGESVKDTIYSNYDTAIVLVAFPSLKEDCLFAEEIRNKHKIHVILAGAVLKYYYDSAMHICNTLSVVGEIEATIPKILEDIKQYGWDNTMSIRNEEHIKDLNTLPFPKWHLIYKKNGFGKVTMLTSRGCFHGCIYCPYPISQGTKYRERSVQNIIDEIISLRNNCGIKVKYILMRNPIFSYNKEKVIKLCEMIISNNLDFKWAIETRPEFLDDELLTVLKKSGCNKISIGIESIDIDVLNFSRGGLKSDYIQKIRDVVKKAKELKMEIAVFFVIGLPFDTKESIEESIRFAEELCVDYTQFSLATPYPGTVLETFGRENNLIEAKDFINYDAFSNPSMRTKNLSRQEIKEIYKNLQQRIEKIGDRRRLERIKNRDFSILSLLKHWKKNIINIGFYKTCFNTIFAGGT